MKVRMKACVLCIFRKLLWWKYLKIARLAYKRMYVKLVWVYVPDFSLIKVPNFATGMFFRTHFMLQTAVIYFKSRLIIKVMRKKCYICCWISKFSFWKIFNTSIISYSHPFFSIKCFRFHFTHCITYLFFYLSIYSFVYLCIYLSICLSV